MDSIGRVRTCACCCTEELKSSPLDHSGTIPPYIDDKNNTNYKNLVLYI